MSQEIVTSLGETIAGTMIHGIHEIMTGTDGLVGIGIGTGIGTGTLPGRGLEAVMIQSSTEGVLQRMTETETVEDQNTTEDLCLLDPMTENEIDRIHLLATIDHHQNELMTGMPEIIHRRAGGVHQHAQATDATHGHLPDFRVDEAVRHYRIVDLHGHLLQNA
uniref:Uncharacterized protein n=1 Tax=Moniliophthora roreri TaxID=221103 RepID=A0A0W0G082_MONRR